MARKTSDPTLSTDTPTPKGKAQRKNSALLEARRAEYVEARASGLTMKDSMEVAGMKYNPGTSHALENHPDIKKALSSEHRKNAYMLGLTREDVLEGMMDAIGQARLIADPMAQIAGWREIAKICGFYAPEVKKIELGDSAKTFLARLEQMDDEELLKMANAEVIDVDFTELPRE
jgi:hypothetical protein